MSDTSRLRKSSNILRDARQLIALEQNWTQGYYARTKTGVPVSHNAPDATCWCSVGAIRKAEPESTTARSDASMDLHLAINENRENECSATPIAVFNDHPRTMHADVLKAFDRAIERAVKREGLVP